MKLRVSLAGTTKNAAECLRDVATELREQHGWKEDDGEDSAVPDPAEQADYYVFALEEISKRARETEAGKHTVTEFAEFYCLADEAKPLILTEIDYPLE